MGELHLKLQKVQESVASTKDWTAQKVIFVLESIYLLGTGMHAALLNLMMSERPEEMGALDLVESDESMMKVKELLDRAQPQWEEIIQLLEARLPRAQSLESRSPPAHHDEHSSLRSPVASHAVELVPTVLVSTLAPASDEQSAPQSPILAAASGVAPAAPTTHLSLTVPTTHLNPTAHTTPSSPTTPSTEAVQRPTDNSSDLPTAPG